ncbi:hypothetical protein B296_00029721 [Ensete ventricosum]|uniref:Uncharacterized protein n=1 Tax=Ensete ventricosum TaxID=4639 RepID=A0A426Z985_ENSVE|nr:hypothetical protein B296_00029721 [Ensete ventricosum]
MENRLQEIFNEFKRSILKNPNKYKHGENSSLKGNRSENIGKSDQGQDTGDPRMRVEFPRWKDRDPISLKFFFVSTGPRRNPRWR